MARPEFEKVVAQAPRMSVVNLAYEFNDAINPGGNELVQFYAPDNAVGRVISVRFSMPKPVGAASGVHEVYVVYDLPGSIPNIDLLYARASYQHDIDFSYLEFVGTYEETKPAQNLDRIVQGVVFDSEIPFTITYWNQTDVVSTASRLYMMTVVYEEIAG